MSLSVSTFKSDNQSKLHGTTFNKITGIFGKMRSAAAKMRLRSKPPTIIRRARIENAIYDKIYNYTAPADIDEQAIIDIRPLGDRSNQDDIAGTFMREFDIKKKNDTAVVEYINGTKTLRLSKSLTARTVLHRMDSLSTEGTITLGGDASNASIETLDFISGSGALKFDLDGVTGQATITIALNAQQDLSDMLDVGALFHWLQFPDVSRLTSVDLEWGESASKYWNETATAAHDRTFEEAGDNGWMLLRHEWVDATENGSPDEDSSEAIDYIKITINYTAGSALSNVRLDNITAAKGQAWEVVYYSTCLFTDSTGTTWKSTPTADTDLIQLDDDGLEIFTDEFMLTIQQDLKGQDAIADIKVIRTDLYGENGKYEQFNLAHPDQSLVRQTTYYNF
jgi:archaellin